MHRPASDAPDLASLSGISVEEIPAEYERRGIDAWSDRRLVATVAGVIAVPKQAPADSFVLHAPLELLARAGLLAYLPPHDREAARHRLVWLAASYEAAGAPVDGPAAFDAPSVEAAAQSLVGALERGDLDDVDRTARWLGEHATPADLRRLLAAPVAASLAAAAHASILLYLLPRVAPAGDVPGGLLRGPARELARHPDWRLRWFEQPDLPAGSASALTDALLDVPMLGLPGSNFILPLMSQAEESGIAPKLLSSVIGAPGGEAPDRRAVAQQLARVAAWSMLQEPPDHAPYGWSHCLTMPQAVMGIARDGESLRVATAVAATHVVGFRAGLGQRPLVAGYTPAHLPAAPLDDMVHAGPEFAAASVWHAPAEEVPGIVGQLAAGASRHYDAHLVKYTLACLDAAADDPTHGRLYLSAAASLLAWWAQFPP